MLYLFRPNIVSRSCDDHDLEHQSNASFSSKEIEMTLAEGEIFDVDLLKFRNHQAGFRLFPLTKVRKTNYYMFLTKMRVSPIKEKVKH